MKHVIKRISDSFIQEALASPRMLEDLAAMEKYMSESYDGRTFVELIQNADDAGSSKVAVAHINGTLIVANNGRPFNEDDIMAISRSGSSNKQRGSSIGYRGVGFKSATTISSEIIIYSSGAYFTFSKSLCAKKLGKPEDKVPAVRIPFSFEAWDLPDGVDDFIDEYSADGFTTFFIFAKANIAKFTSELEGFNSGWLLFLNNIKNVSIKLPGLNTTCKVARKEISATDNIVKIIGGKEQWYVTTDGAVALAFKYEDERGIVACSGSDANFHCFLPTLDKTGFPFKANADFSTDPSRKHLIKDELTANAIKRLQKLFASFVTRAVESKDDKLINVVSLISSPLALNDLASELEQGILVFLRNSEWIVMNDGRVVSPENAYTFPTWLTSDEQSALIESIDEISRLTPSRQVYGQIEKFDKLLYKLGAKELSLKEFALILKSADRASKINNALVGKLSVYTCRGMLSDRDWLAELFVPLQGGQLVRLMDASGSSVLDVSYLTAFEMLNSRERTTLSESFSVFACLGNKSSSVSNTGSAKKQVGLGSLADVSKKANLAVNKWKTPIQNCISIEALSGWTGKDVSKKNTEYSILSTNATGETRYIAVKKVDILGDSFKLSEAEYVAAERLGSAYEVFIIATEGTEIEYIYIKDPLNTLSLDKVVKEWEWCCEDYKLERHKDTSTPEIFDANFLKNMSADYFNSLQIEFLKKVMAEQPLTIDTKEQILVQQINSITDFYTGSALLKNDAGAVSIIADKLSALKKLIENK